MGVLVTGIGVVSPLGIGVEPTWRGLLGDRSAIGRLELFELEGCKVDVAAEVPGLRVVEVAPPGAARGWSRADAMAVLAAREAVASAGAPALDRADLVVGGTTAGMLECEELLATLTGHPETVIDAEALRPHPLTAPTDRVHAAVGPFRSARTLCSACSGGAAAIIVGAAAIQCGRADLVIAGGVDGLCRLTYSGFAALGALDRAPCRPFDRRRAGLSLGEGAAFLVLESPPSAERRGAVPIAELVGWGMAAEAHHPTHPEPDGATAAWVIERALRRSGLGPADVDYVNAHGTATPQNDAMECRALELSLGAELSRVLVSSTKGHLGHALGAAGAIEAAICCLAIERGAVPPTVGLEEPDRECAIRHVRQARQLPVRAALSNSFGFGGTDTALLFATPGLRPAPASGSPRSMVITGGATVGPLGICGSRASFDYTRRSEPVSAPPAPAELRLDPTRARRFDRAARLTTAAIESALDDAALDVDRLAAVHGLGTVVGSAFGSVGSTGRYLERLFGKGARWASPALFPGALPSALGANASLYAQLTGPVLSAADLALSAEGALAVALELVACGDGDAIVAAAVEEQSEVAERVSGPLCSGLGSGAQRGEGAAALIVEAAASARRR
ncbi:MAG: beta-ketoacyl-[acyl-carrier-protein] synthase family protein, partial [Deltaproteobacteria bacterium]|nr:beta-ketoacyl-[acyl-carrier-protein] synthase family protein [Deltaproteobacteria bacterium]MBW2534745.1 beta-ketoacyl-[acyl-carrier-protein] synthase family protein [Deltaproteobacteria bacterium]